MIKRTIWVKVLYGGPRVEMIIDAPEDDPIEYIDKLLEAIMKNPGYCWDFCDGIS